MKKCIVLDLDNTLWGGVIGEDGIQGLSLSVSSPGSSFVAFQQALLDQYNRGVILAINSRNNPEDALEVIRTHPNMILKENHFAAMRINWSDKAQNIRELAEELNIGLDSMVFLDDDPTNRALVKSMVPEVEVPDLPVEPSSYAQFLHSLPYFPTEAATNEDTMRGNLYVTERLRREEEKNFSNKEDFLSSLSLKLTVFEDDASCVPRLSQLTEKTNQFNTDKHPLSEAEVTSYIDSPDTHVFYARLVDKFGDHGVILFALVEDKKTTWHIRQLLMSCRVFDRGVEDAFLAALMERAFQSGAEKVTIAYTETPKNIPAKTFIDRQFSNFERTTPLVAPTWIKTTYEHL